MTQLKWGILSAGKISNDFVIALSTLPEEEHKAVAVAARDLDNAKKFGHTHGIPKTYGSYEQLVNDNEVGKFDTIALLVKTKKLANEMQSDKNAAWCKNRCDLHWLNPH